MALVVGKGSRTPSGPFRQGTEPINAHPAFTHMCNLPVTLKKQLSGQE